MGVPVFIAALQDFLRARRLFAWIFAILVVALISRLWAGLTPTLTAREAYAQVTAILNYRLLALAAAILSTAVLSQEVEQKTIVYLITRPVDRRVLLLARTFAAILTVVLVSWLLAFATSGAVYGTNVTANPLLTRDLIGMTVGAFAYCSFFVLISLWFKRALIACLLYAFGWEILAANMSGDIYYLSIYKYLEAISQRPAISGPGPMEVLAGQAAVTTMSTQTAWTAMIVFILVCLGLAAYRFRWKEVLPSEDPE
jgi:ABC-2 type transport system permease protein